MIIIVGLGNPGQEFNGTRHNVGFEVVDFFAKQEEFPEFEFSKKYNALISKKEEVLLVKPQTFMNDSGASLQRIVKDNRSQITDIVIVHDDIDLLVGKLKVIKERGSAGHKGVESVIASIGNENLVRFRVGIGQHQMHSAKEVVLKKFNQEEQEIIYSVIQRASQALVNFMKEGLERTMNRFNI